MRNRGFRLEVMRWKLLVLVGALAARSAMAEMPATVQTLIDRGDFAEAEAKLRTQIEDTDAPIVDGAAVQLEILRRTRRDFSLDQQTVLEQVQASIPDATAEDLQRWRESRALQSRTIDGEVRYFRRAVSNLYRFSEEAERRREEHAGEQPPSPGKFQFTKHIARLVALSDKSVDAEIYPVRHRVTYQLSVKSNHPRVKTGAVVRAWLPFPQSYRQQRDVQLLDSEPPVTLVTDNGVPHRTLYFEQVVDTSEIAPTFRASFEFVTSAYCPKLDPRKVQSYDIASESYRHYTAERLPHIQLSSEVRELAGQIVGEEANPLGKAIRVFRWVSQNIPWCGEMEYCIIPNLSAKGLRARRGDCGVQGMTFITLCRAAGVPARWQSGWETKPGEENMHDWSEVYIEPWGWLPVDASYGVRDHEDSRVQNFLCGHMDAYRLIVNLDYARDLQPAKTSFRSEPNDFQRGEIEIDGHNLYFDEWSWNFDVETKPLASFD
ncbi:MAG: transglutaminase domain-containing protein [Planctomycetota bacterium]